MTVFDGTDLTALGPGLIVLPHLRAAGFDDLVCAWRHQRLWPARHPQRLCHSADHRGPPVIECLLCPHRPRLSVIAWRWHTIRHHPEYAGDWA